MIAAALRSVKQRARTKVVRSAVPRRAVWPAAAKIRPTGSRSARARGSPRTSRRTHSSIPAAINCTNARSSARRRRAHLLRDLGAIAPLLQHPLDAADLALDPPQAARDPAAHVVGHHDGGHRDLPFPRQRIAVAAGAVSVTATSYATAAERVSMAETEQYFSLDGSAGDVPQADSGEDLGMLGRALRGDLDGDPLKRGAHLPDYGGHVHAGACGQRHRHRLHPAGPGGGPAMRCGDLHHRRIRIRPPAVKPHGRNPLHGDYCAPTLSPGSAAPPARARRTRPPAARPRTRRCR